MSPFHAKIENICRLCLSGDDTLESIFGDSGSDSLPTIIYDCTSIRIQRKMGFPSSICCACKMKIESFHQFREQCKHNDEYLRSTLLPVVTQFEGNYSCSGGDDDDGEDDEDEVIIKMEPEVLLEERSDIDPKEIKAEDDGTGDDGDPIESFGSSRRLDRNENRLDLHKRSIDRCELDGWNESGSNDPDRDSIGNSSDSMHHELYMSPESLGYDGLHKCEYCSQEFSVLEQLKRHITSHKEERIFQCYYCPKTFHFAKNLNMHVEYIHSKAKYSQPPPTTFSSRTANGQRPQFLLHSSSSSNNGTVSPSSTNDDDTLSPIPLLLDNIDNLNNNNTISTGAGTDLKLNINLSGGSSSNGSEASALGRTVKSIRLSTTIGHECHVCHKSFHESTALRQHMLVHTGEKPYKCDICSKSFYNASTLKTHQRIHSDQNPYRCAICTKMFDNARSLELHHRTHTGEKPYACDVCLKKFSCSSNLKRHRKLHDRD
uniref:Putative sequence-specific dna binding transcription factor n=1 Tax=Anopheles marajoara TaxID=58244 RepID=A0A2M4BLI9_9DIPT